MIRGITRQPVPNFELVIYDGPQGANRFIPAIIGGWLNRASLNFFAIIPIPLENLPQRFFWV